MVECNNTGSAVKCGIDLNEDRLDEPINKNISSEKLCELFDKSSSILDEENMTCMDDIEVEDVMRMTFDSIEDAENFYNAYARCVGFSIRKDDRKWGKEKMIMRRWVCSKQGYRNSSSLNREDKHREQKALTRCGCQSLFRVRFDKQSSRYVVTNFVKEHNHELLNQYTVPFLLSHRSINSCDGAQARSMSNAGIRTSQIMLLLANKVGGFRDVGFTIKDLYNHLNQQRKFDIRDGDAEAALAYLRSKADNDPTFSVKYKIDEENRLSILLWADSSSRYDYSVFGDVLVLDSTYKTDAYHKPLVVLAGVNNHFMSIIFACALLPDESIETYTWIFKTFLTMMEQKQPVSVVTDGDKAMNRAISDVFPQARHRLCSWHLQRNVVKHVHRDGFAQEFSNCMKKRCSKYEFDNMWMDLVSKFNLENSEWVSDTFSNKDKWAKAYLNGHFFGGMSSTQRCEGMHSFLKKHVNKASKLYEFVRSFESAMGWLRHKKDEQYAINKNSAPVMITQLKSLESHAAKIYTRKVFYKVRKQLEKVVLLSFTGSRRDGLIHTYSMSEYKKTSNWDVSIHLNTLDMQCSCLKLESVGWPCSHMFTVMKAENLVEIPISCIKKRWTIEAKNGLLMRSQNYIPCDVRQLACYGSLYQQCKEMCYYASQVPEGYQNLSEAIFTETEKIKFLYMKYKNKDVDVASNVDDESVTQSFQKFDVRDPLVVKTKGERTTDHMSKSKPRCSKCNLPGHYKSTCKKDNLDENSQNKRMRFQSTNHGDDIDLNILEEYNFMQSL